MPTPQLSEQGTRFNLAAERRELRASPELAQEGHTARTLVRTDDLRVVLVVMKEGGRMADHFARATACVQVLEGAVRLGIGEREVAVMPGELFVMAAGLRHAVFADRDSAFLLTLVWSPNATRDRG